MTGELLHPAARTMLVTVTCGTAALAVLLARLARSMGRWRESPRAGGGAGLFGAAACVTSTTSLLVAITGATSVGVMASASGTVVAAGIGVCGLLFLPEAAGTWTAWLRRCLDGITVIACLMYAAWILVITPGGGDIAARHGAIVATCATCAGAVVATARADRRWRSELVRAIGAALATLGGVTVTLALAAERPATPWLVAGGVAQLLGPAMIALGLRGASSPARAGAPGWVGRHPADLAEARSLARYPLLVGPLAIAVCAALVHLSHSGKFDPTSIAFALFGVSVLAARETLATADVRRYARLLAAREAHFRSLVAESSDVTMVLGADLVVRWQSPASLRQFGLDDGDVVGRPFPELVHPLDAAKVTERLTAVVAASERVTFLNARLRDGSGQWRDTESTISDQRATPEVGALVLHLRDVSDRRELERSLHLMSWTDQVTGLGNRRKLLHAAGELRAAGGRHGALLLIELDGVSGVNGARGSDTGDAVLVEAARRVRVSLGDHDVAARLGDEEFAVLADSPPVSAYALANRLVTFLGEPYRLSGFTVRISPSIGVAELHGGGRVEDVLRHADLARRRAAQIGGGRVESFDESIEVALVRQMTIEQELAGAAERGELELSYQPILDLASMRPVGVEALLRWRSPTLGAVPPADLIPVAERIGVIDEIGRWVLNRACRQLSLWRQDGRELWMSVNVSPAQFSDEAFVASARAALELHAVPPDRLVVELSERGVGEPYPLVACRLAELRAIGVRVAIDGFGTCQSGLSNVRKLPIDVIKADQGLFSETPDGGDPVAPIAEAVVEMARRMSVEVVATGLENQSRCELAMAAGFRLGQGFHLASPEHAERVEAFLERHRTPLF